MKPLDALVEGLTLAEKHEFANAIHYLDERMDNDNGRMPEGGIGQLLNSLSPNVREKFQLLSQTLETPRVAPFAPKLSERDYADALGLDADRTELVKAAIDGQEVMGKLQQRMGTDADRPQEPPTRREQIQAALEASEATQKGN